MPSVLRRLLLAVLGALALAAPASAFTKEDGMQMMDDDVAIAYTLYTPDGAAPAAGWPCVVVLHGLARRAARSRRSRRTSSTRATPCCLRRPRPRRIRRRRHARRPARGRRPPGCSQCLRRPPQRQRHENRRLGHLVRWRPDLQRTRRRRSLRCGGSRRADGRRSTTHSGRKTSRARASSRASPPLSPHARR